MSNIAYVLGNGKSRLKYDLEGLRETGFVTGCNAIYRDFTPDLLVSVDTGIATEIFGLEHSYDGLYYYVKKGTKAFFSNKSGKVVVNARGWASGSSAAWLTLMVNPEVQIVNLIGMDLYGLSNNKVNNIYAGSKWYSDPNNPPAANCNWIKQFGHVFSEYPNVRFYRVGDITQPVPDKWMKYPNIEFVEEPVLV